MASLGVDSGYVPYTAFSAKTRLYGETPRCDPGIYRCITERHGICQYAYTGRNCFVIQPQFSETDTDTITTIIRRYQEQDTSGVMLEIRRISDEIIEEL